MFMCAFFNGLSGLSQKEQIFYFSIKTVDPLIISILLIIAAADQDRRLHHCLDCFDRRIRIRPLGIIVIIHVIYRGGIFNAVFHCRKLFYRHQDIFHGHPGHLRHGDRCHHVFYIMYAQKFHFMDIHQLSVRGAHDILSLQPKAVFGLFCRIKEYCFCATAVLCKIHQTLVFAIQHADLLCALVPCDILFARRIGFHRMMTI